MVVGFVVSALCADEIFESVLSPITLTETAARRSQASRLLNPLFGRPTQTERSEEEHGSSDKIKYDRTPSWYLPTETKEVGREDVAQSDTNP